MERMLPHVRAGMTHLAQDIGSSALDILQWALEVGGEELVACPGGWLKTMKSLLVMMGWRGSSTAAAAETSHDSSSNNHAGWSSNSNKSAVFGQAGSKEGKILVKCVDTLSALLLAGLGVDENGKEEEEREVWGFPLSHTAQHMLPQRSNPYGYLNLFGPPRDEESAGYVYREDRQRVFARRFQLVIREGLAGLKKEAGEYGRAAAKAEKIVADCMRGFDQVEDDA